MQRYIQSLLLTTLREDTVEKVCTPICELISVYGAHWPREGHEHNTCQHAQGHYFSIRSCARHILAMCRW